MLNEARLAMLRLGLSVPFHHQMALDVHAGEKLSSFTESSGRSAGTRVTKWKAITSGRNGSRWSCDKKEKPSDFYRRLSYYSGSSAASRLLELRVRIPPGAWLSACYECCLLSGRVICDGPILRPEDSCRVCACH